MTVDIPADVKDNSTHSIRVQWRGVRDARPNEIESGRRYLKVFGYTLHEWDDIDRDGTRVTLHRFVNGEGQTIDLFATYYFTRVKCTDCEHSYAETYIAVIDPDGVIRPAAPFCGTHGHVVRRIADRTPGYSCAQSEPLIIGQH